MNDIKGIDAPALDAWSTAAALAAVTERLELMVAVRPQFHPPGEPRQAGGEHRSDLERPPGAERRLELVGRRSAPLRRALRSARRPLRPHRRVARRRERRVARAAFTHQGKYYRSDDGHRRAEAGAPPAPDDLRRRRVRGREDSHRARLRRVRHARRSAGAHRAEGRRHARVAARRAAFPRWSSAWRPTPSCAPRSARRRRELARITNVDPGSAGYHNYQDWLANTQARAARVARGLFGVESRAARRAGRDAGAGRRPHSRLQDAGVGLLLLQCSPQFEEMERFADEVMPLTGSLAVG